MPKVIHVSFKPLPRAFWYIISRVISVLLLRIVISMIDLWLCVKYFTRRVSFNSLYLTYYFIHLTDKKTAIWRSSNLPRITQLTRSRAGIQTVLFTSKVSPANHCTLLLRSINPIICVISYRYKHLVNLFMHSLTMYLLLVMCQTLC